MNRTKLNLRPGQKGRLIAAANVPVDETTAKWNTTTSVVVLDPSKQRTVFDMLVVASAIGIALVEFTVDDADGNDTISHVFEIEVTEQAADAAITGEARVSRESIESPPLSSIESDAPAEPPQGSPVEESPAIVGEAEPAGEVTSPADTEVDPGLMAGFQQDNVANSAVEVQSQQDASVEAADTPPGQITDDASASATESDASPTEEVSPASDPAVEETGDSAASVAEPTGSTGAEAAPIFEVPAGEIVDSKPADESATSPDEITKPVSDAAIEKANEPSGPSSLLDATATEESGS
jgi:hypothetical protein